jgi:Cu/Ag efflux pump CusA
LKAIFGGWIALFGIAAQNGVILLSQINLLRRKGRQFMMLFCKAPSAACVQW